MYGPQIVGVSPRESTRSHTFFCKKFSKNCIKKKIKKVLYFDV